MVAQLYKGGWPGQIELAKMALNSNSRTKQRGITRYENRQWTLPLGPDDVSYTVAGRPARGHLRSQASSTRARLGMRLQKPGLLEESPLGLMPPAAILSAEQD